LVDECQDLAQQVGGIEVLGVLGVDSGGMLLGSHEIFVVTVVGNRL
jgi:hypothetical protein